MKIIIASLFLIVFSSTPVYKCFSIFQNYNFYLKIRNNALVEYLDY